MSRLIDTLHVAQIGKYKKQQLAFKSNRCDGNDDEMILEYVIVPLFLHTPLLKLL